MPLAQETTTSECPLRAAAPRTEPAARMDFSARTELASLTTAERLVPPTLAALLGFCATELANMLPLLETLAFPTNSASPETATQPAKESPLEDLALLDKHATLDCIVQEWSMQLAKIPQWLEELVQPVLNAHQDICATSQCSATRQRPAWPTDHKQLQEDLACLCFAPQEWFAPTPETQPTSTSLASQPEHHLKLAQTR